MKKTQQLRGKLSLLRFCRVLVPPVKDGYSHPSMSLVVLDFSQSTDDDRI